MNTKKPVIITENSEHESATSEHHIRLEKLKAMEAAGINPWPAAKEVSATCKQVHQEFNEITPIEYSVAGRIRVIRHFGKASFVVIQDATGQLQLYLKQDELGNTYDLFKKFIDVGDIVWAKGSSFKTKTGETSIKVDAFELLSKCFFRYRKNFMGCMILRPFIANVILI